MRRLAFAALFCALPLGALAQTPSAPGETAAAEAPQLGIIPAGTTVTVELAEPLRSDTSQIGQLFQLRLRDPIMIDGREVVPAGATGGGEVIDAQDAGFGGREGKLILAGRYLEIGGQRVRLRGLRITGVGDNRAHEALAVSMIPVVGLGSMFMQGGEIEMPAGAYGTARLAADVDIPFAPAASPSPSAPAVEITVSGENLE